MDFWESIFGAKERGLVRIALNRRDRKFNQRFIEWPKERKVLDGLEEAKERGDLYFSPALFKTASASKANVLGARVGWVDCDSELDNWNTEPKPAIVIGSGSPNRTHLYFPLPGLIDPSTVEKYNRYLTAVYNGDRSGWDANQLLRVPNTYNWKTNPPKPVRVLQFEPNELWYPPKQLDIEEPKVEIPQTEFIDVLLSRELPDRLRGLLTQHPIECFDRSAGLYHVAALASEAGLNPGEVYAVTAYADSKWGKFSGRDDKELRLTEIVRRVFAGRLTVDSPFEQQPKQPHNKIKSVGWFDLADSEEKVEWVIENFVRKNGLTLIVGPTKSGKSTLALGLTAKIVAGATDFLGFPIVSKDEKILYASLEMDKFTLNHFLSGMSMILRPLQERLNERARFLAVGHSIPLDLEHGQKKYEEELSAGNYTGLVIDTLGASVSTSLSDEKVMRAIVDWCERARQQFNIWIVILHHPRKAPNASNSGRGRKHEYTADDLYGARLIGDRADASFLLDGRVFRNLNSRFGPQIKPMPVYRTDDGWIERGSREGVEGGFSVETPFVPETEKYEIKESNNPIELE